MCSGTGCHGLSKRVADTSAGTHLTYSNCSLGHNALITPCQAVKHYVVPLRKQVSCLWCISPCFWFVIGQNFGQVRICQPLWVHQGPYCRPHSDYSRTGRQAEAWRNCCCCYVWQHRRISCHDCSHERVSLHRYINPAALRSAVSYHHRDFNCWTLILVYPCVSRIGTQIWALVVNGTAGAVLT